MNSSSLSLRPMNSADIPLGMSLKKAANWNQTAADWELLIQAGNSGNFIAEWKRQAVGTITTLNYQGKFGWIGVLLVDPAHRRKGIGRALLEKALHYAADLGPLRLDATPLGKNLYDLLGFQRECEIQRMLATEIKPEFPALLKCQKLSGDQFSKLMAYDLPIFGANREIILRNLWERTPQYAFFAHQDERIVGYCLGRSGSDFEQIGPIVADHTEIAVSLLSHALTHCFPKKIIIDTSNDSPVWMAYLQQLGFQKQRTLYRMYLGDFTPTEQSDKQFTFAGPEFG